MAAGLFGRLRLQTKLLKEIGHTVCPRSLDRFQIVSYYMNWVKTLWTNSTALKKSNDLSKQ